MDKAHIAHLAKIAPFIPKMLELFPTLEEELVVNRTWFPEYLGQLVKYCPKFTEDPFILAFLIGEVFATDKNTTLGGELIKARNLYFNFYRQGDSL